MRKTHAAWCKRHFSLALRCIRQRATLTPPQIAATQDSKELKMKNINKLALRLIAAALLCTSLSACVTTNTEALYYTPTASSHQIYGYSAVDFNALNVR